MTVRMGHDERDAFAQGEALCDTSAAVESLRGLALFSDCTDRQLVQCGRFIVAVEVDPGTTLCRQGERGRQFFVALVGTFGVTVHGKPIVVLGRGDWFGEISLRQNCGRVASVTALTTGKVLVFNPHEYHALRTTCPTVAKRVDATLRERLIALQDVECSRGQWTGDIGRLAL